MVPDPGAGALLRPAGTFKENQVAMRTARKVADDSPAASGIQPAFDKGRQGLSIEARAVSISGFVTGEKRHRSGWTDVGEWFPLWD